MQTLKAQAQAGPRSFSEIQQDPLYVNADAAQQALAAQEYFNQYVATQNAYKQAKPEQQKAAFNEFVTQYNIPMPDRQPITTGQGFQHKARPMVGFPAGVAGGPAVPAIQVSSPEAAQQIQRTTGQGASLALNDYVKGATFGYGDVNRLAGNPLKRETFLKQNPEYQPVVQGSEFAGSLIPIEIMGSIGNQGINQLQNAGQRLAINQNVPRYLQGIAEKSVPYLRNIGNQIGKIGPIGRSMLEQGLGFGLYESAKAREGADQFDPMGRAISGIEGAAIGALGAGALGLLGKGAGAAYGQLKNIFAGTAAPTSLGKVLQGQVQKTGEASIKYLESTAQDLQNLLEDIFANNAQGKLSNKSIKKLSTVKERMGRAAMGEINLTTAEVRAHRSALNQIRREVRAGVKAEGRELKPAAQVTQAEKELQAKTAPIVAQVEVSKKETQRLQAEIAKLEEQLAKTPEASAEIEVTERKLTAQVEKQVKAIRDKYAKRKQEVKQKPFNSRGSVYDSKEKQLYELGIRESAEVRQAIQGDSLEDLSDVGGLTKTELQAVIKKEASNYQGKAVIVEGKPATVIQPAFGKVKVKFKDGTEKTVPREAVIPAIKPTSKPRVQEVKVKKPNPEAQTQLDKRKALEAQIEKRRQALSEAEAKATEAEKQLAEAVKAPEPQAQPTRTQAEQPKKLTGDVQEMAQQALEDSGLSLDKARSLVGEVKALGNADDDAVIMKLKEQRKALGNKRDDATKEAKAKIDAQIKTRKDERAALREEADKIHPNLRAVLGTEWDGVSAIAKQNPVAETQLKGEAVKDLITNAKEQKIFQAIDDAAQQAKTVKVRHHAEITGSTDAAAKVTAKGNVIVPLSEFTPTHFEVVTKNGKQYVAAVGYNDLGYESRYYITKSPEGSFIQEVKAASGERFVGTTPNVYLGPRDYKVADVLSREARQEGVLTSEAMNNAKLLKDFTTGEAFTKLPKPVQSIMKGIQKRGRFTKSELAALQKELNKDLKQLEEVCQIMGIK